jgi:acetyl-CoA C-acetyltransferase
MREVYITHAKRTAIGSFMGNFSATSSIKLGARVLSDILHQSAIDPFDISEVIMGQVLVGGLGQNPARQTSIESGVPEEVPAFTVGKVCGSGLKAISLGAQSIETGNADIVIAGGQENMSLASHALYARSGIKMGSGSLIDMMMYDGLTDVFSNLSMGITAENIAKRFNISREIQDDLAYHSQIKATNAMQSGRFKDEITQIEVEIKRQKVIIDQDEFIKPNTTLDGLAKLRPAFDKDGTVTAGSASGINDGAAAVLLVSKEALLRYNLIPIARVVSYASAGVSPDIMGTGPVPASKKAIQKAGWTISDIDLIEANEAFASQAAYVNIEMGWDTSKVNVNGGSIALGHPIGASGARIMVTLLHEMKKRSAKRGIATLCIGGGMGIAMCVEGV